MTTTNSLLAVTILAKGDADGTWANDLQSAFEKFDRGVAGYLAKSVAGSSNVTLTQAESEEAVIKFTGTLTGNIEVYPQATKEKVWWLWNATSGSFTLEFKTSAGTGVLIPQGARVLVFCDGTNIEKGLQGFWDDDGDTGIQWEEGADDDTVRIDAGGNEVATFEDDTVTLKPSGTAELTITSSLCTIGVDALVQEANDGADTNLTIDNSSGSGSTDETATLAFQHATQVGGKLVSVRTSDYSSAANRDSALDIYTAYNGSDNRVARFDQPQGLGRLLINDTANGNQDCGLTINQGAQDNEAITLKSSDVATARTSESETDSYATFQKANAAQGGLLVKALCEDDTEDAVLRLEAHGGTAGTTQDSSADGLITLYAEEHDGANTAANITANGIVCAVKGRVGGSERALWFVDEDGDTFQDGTAGTAFDAYADAEMVRGTMFAMSDPATIIRNRFDSLVRYGEDELTRAGVLTYCSPENRALGHRPMVNMSQVTRMLMGATWQQQCEINELREDIADLKQQIGLVPALRRAWGRLTGR